MILVRAVARKLLSNHKYGSKAVITLVGKMKTMRMLTWRTSNYPHLLKRTVGGRVSALQLPLLGMTMMTWSSK
jgi:hypothetical protein